MLGLAKVVFSILLSGMTAIGRTMESGRRGYGASSGRKSLEFFWLGRELRGCSDWLLGTVNSDSNWLPWGLRFRKWGCACLVGKKEINSDKNLKEREGEFSYELPSITERGCGSPVIKVPDHGRHVMSSSPVPLKTCRVGQRYTLNLSRAQTSSRWYSVVVRREDASSDVVHVT
ncbi:hypothetical protein TNCV_945371 [Trichonephila clavipes]|nr:hypothetical protein TNCV_945371 [Trichonephila clavipes]